MTAGPASPANRSNSRAWFACFRRSHSIPWDLRGRGAWHRIPVNDVDQQEHHRLLARPAGGARQRPRAQDVRRVCAVLRGKGGGPGLRQPALRQDHATRKGAGRPGYQEGEAYPGAKPSMMIGADFIEDGERLCELIRATAAALPPPKPRKTRRRKP